MQGNPSLGQPQGLSWVETRGLGQGTGLWVPNSCPQGPPSAREGDCATATSPKTASLSLPSPGKKGAGKEGAQGRVWEGHAKLGGPQTAWGRIPRRKGPQSPGRGWIRDGMEREGRLGFSGEEDGGKAALEGREKAQPEGERGRVRCGVGGSGTR